MGKRRKKLKLAKKRTATSGPNAPCFCGSGTKTKLCRCVYIKEEQQAIFATWLGEQIATAEIRDRILKAMGMTLHELTVLDSDAQWDAFQAAAKRDPGAMSVDHLHSYLSGAA